VPCATDVILLIEVADTTLAYDRGTKLALYAQHSIPEVWIVDVSGQRLEAYQEPGAEGYRRKLEFSCTDTVAPAALPAVKVFLEEVFR